MHFMSRAALAFAFLVLAAGSLPAAADSSAGDWPCFLGPRGDNTSAETGLLDRWPTNGPALVWEKVVGTGYSAPSVRGERLVLHHRSGGSEVVEAFHATTGASLWKHAYPSSFVDPYGYNNGPRCTPLLTSNRCYTFGAEGKLLSLDLATGRPLWSRDTARDWEIPEAFFGVGSTPLLEGGRLIVMLGGQPNAGVVALDPDTGKTLWENVGRTNWSGVVTLGWRAENPYRWSGHEKQASYASPVAATFHGQRHLLCLMRQGLVSLNPTNGTVNFSRWFQSEANDSVNAMSPVVHGDTILLSAAYYRVGAVLLRVKPDGKSFDEVWRSPRHPMERDTATGRFRVPALEVHWSTPILHDGFIYAFSGRNEPDANLRCVEYLTGQVRWERSERWAGHPPPGAKAQPAVFGRGSAILADGKMIALGEGGLLGLFRPSPDRVEELARFQAPALHFPCWAAPILSRGRLYLRSEDRLVCYQVSGRKDP